MKLETEGPATRKAALLRAAVERKGWSYTQVVAEVRRRQGVTISKSSVAFALNGRAKSGEVYHGMRQDRVSVLIAKTVGVHLAELFEAHALDEKDARDRAAQDKKAAEQQLRAIVARVRRDIRDKQARQFFDQAIENRTPAEVQAIVNRIIANPGQRQTASDLLVSAAKASGDAAFTSAYAQARAS